MPENIQQSNTQGSMSTPTVPYHKHGGGDGPPIPAQNVSGSFPMVTTTPTNTPTGAINGSLAFSSSGSEIFYYDTVNKEWKSITQTSIYYPYFGDGSDGALTAASGTTTLTRDTYYTNVTLSGTAKIVTSGYRLFVNGTLNISGSASVQYNGNNGTAGVNGNSGGTGGQGGAGGSALAAGSIPGGQAGATGGQGASIPNNTSGLPGAQGGSGAGTQPSIGANGTTGGAGGAGGLGGNAGGGSQTGGTAGTVVLAYNLPRTIFAAYNNFDQETTYTLHQGSASGGAGSGGSSGGAQGQPASGQAGGGGGSGSTGGIVVVFAYTIINSATGGVQALGGNGAHGGNAVNSVVGAGVSVGGCGGGGGGAGGTGGVLIIVYNTLTQTGSFLVTGGTAGAGGTGGNGAGASFVNGSPGSSGSAGGTGVIWEIQI